MASVFSDFAESTIHPTLPVFGVDPKPLTPIVNQANIAVPLTHSAVGRGNPFFIGQKAATVAAFLCPTILKTGSVRLFSIMVDLFGQRLALAGSYDRFSTPFKSATRYRGKYRRRLFNFHRITAMNIQPTRANSAQNPTAIPLFSIYWHRQCLRIGIAGALALRIKRRFPACIVAFSGFEGGAE